MTGRGQSPRESQGQEDVIAFLSDPATHGGASVERHETHGALVFLAGDAAYKIKRAVRYSYMDFSTLAKREAACRQEIEVNKRLAPEIYLGVVAVTRGTDGRLRLGGDGTPVEWAVHMRRFADADILSRRAEAGPLEPQLARAVADAVYDSHRTATVASGVPVSARLAATLDGLVKELDAAALGASAGDVAAFAAAARERIKAATPLMERRAAAGFARRCHGDLHLANIVLWKGKPVLFDAIEFDEKLSTIDTLYDLAFLLMDLDVHRQRGAANMVLGRYLWRSRDLTDIKGLAALPLFLALRAGIRAMVLAERARLQHGPAAERSRAAARRYWDAAVGTLHPSPPRLVAVGGLSGTGKSTLAATLAPSFGAAPGALHLRSDLERKALADVAETDRLPAASYTAEASAAVYARLLERVGAALAAGHAVVVDAVFSKAEERADIEGIARRHGARFHGLWLTAPAEVLIARVSARVGDASDATADVVRQQLTRDDGAPGWSTVLADSTPAATLSAARRVLGLG